MKIRTFVFLLAFIPLQAHSAAVANKAPDFILRDLSGKVVTLESLKGKVVFLDFWATWCTPCKEELQEIENLYQKYRKDGLEIVGISMDKSESTVVEFLRNHPISFIVLVDTKGTVGESYQLPGMPTGYIIDKKGFIRHKHIGFSREFVPLYEKEITELLKKP